MGVRRLFSRGGQKFSGEGEPTFCLKNNEKDTIFPQKSLKTYYFWPAREGRILVGAFVSKYLFCIMAYKFVHRHFLIMKSQCQCTVFYKRHLIVASRVLIKTAGNLSRTILYPWGISVGQTHYFPASTIEGCARGCQQIQLFCRHGVTNWIDNITPLRGFFLINFLGKEINKIESYVRY
jgi:hypothetical protein